MASSSAPPTLDAAIARAGEASTSASVGALRTAFTCLSDSLKSSGYDLPAPATLPPPQLQVKSGSTAPAKAPAGAAKAPPATSSSRAGTASSRSPAKPAAKPGAAPASRVTASKPVPGRATTAAKPTGNVASKPAAQTPTKSGAAAAAPPKAVGTFAETKLEVSPPRPGVLVSLSLSFKPSLELPAKTDITLALPGFIVPANPKLPLSTPAGLTAAAVAEPPSVVFSVEADKKLDAGGLVDIKFSDPAVISSPVRGITSEQVRELTLAASSAAASIPASPLETAPSIRASQMTAKVHAALLQLGWLLWEAGPFGWDRNDHCKVATRVFVDVFRDTHEVEGKEADAMQAAAGLLCCRTGTAVEMDKKLLRAIPAMGEAEKESSGEGAREDEGTGEEKRKKDLVDGAAADAEQVLQRVVLDDKLTKEGRLALARFHCAKEDFDKAVALLEGPGLELAKALCLQRRYLSVLNHTPELDRLTSLLDELCTAFKAAVEKEKGGAEAVVLAWCGAAASREEAALVQDVYGGAAAGGQEAGVDQAATDSANLDEVKAILKNRGVFGKPSVEEQIKELEDEYHENIKFGLHSQAEIVAALLEWFRAYRTRQERGGETYSKKEEKEPDIVGKAELEEALALYKKALIAGGGEDVVMWQPHGGGEATLQTAMARVQCKLRDWIGAAESVGKARTPLSEEGALWCALAEMGKAKSMGLDGGAGKSVVERVGAALRVFGDEGRRLVAGEPRLVQSVTLLCATPLRPYNLSLAELAFEVGSKSGAEGAGLLEDAMTGLDGVPLLGMSLSMKEKANTLKVKICVELAKAWKNGGKKKSAWDLCTRIHEMLRFASKSEVNLEARAEASLVGVEVWEGSCDAQGRRGEALWLLREMHPKHKNSADLLDQAEECFNKALSLENSPSHLPSDPSVAPTASPAATSPAPAKPTARAAPPSKPAAPRAPVPAKPSPVKPAAAKPTPAPAAGSGADKSTAGAGAKAAGGGGTVTNGLSWEGRMGMAQVLAERAGGDPTALSEASRAAVVAAYEKAIQVNPRDIEPYMKIGEILDIKDPKAAAAIFARFPLNFDSPDKDDAFISGEVVRLMMRGKDHTKWTKGCDELISVGKGLLVMALVQGLDVISMYVEKLEAANHTGILCEVYAAANKRTVDDEEMKKFYRLKGWLIDKEALKAAIHHARVVRGEDAL